MSNNLASTAVSLVLTVHRICKSSNILFNILVTSIHAKIHLFFIGPLDCGCFHLVIIHNNLFVHLEIVLETMHICIPSSHSAVPPYPPPFINFSFVGL